jgi:centrosomal protein CEP350
LPEDLIYAVPNQKEQLVPLIHDTAEVFWERRRYGESWDDVEPPTEFFSSEDQGADMESRSKKVYKRMVFDVTAEVLRDLYKEESQSEDSFWTQFRKQRAWPVRERSPPTTLQALKPVLEQRVLRVLHRQDPSKERLHKKTMKTWSSRKKKDHVDQILVQELRQEEPEWINYDEDELAVKIQLADAIFDSLLTETGQMLTSIQQKRANHR